MSALPKPPPSSAVETVDTRFLETLMGYNARRASLAIVEHFMRRAGRGGHEQRKVQAGGFGF